MLFRSPQSKTRSEVSPASYSSSRAGQYMASVLLFLPGAPFEAVGSTLTQSWTLLYHDLQKPKDAGMSYKHWHLTVYGLHHSHSQPSCWLSNPSHNNLKNKKYQTSNTKIYTTYESTPQWSLKPFSALNCSITNTRPTQEAPGAQISRF